MQPQMGVIMYIAISSDAMQCNVACVVNMCVGFGGDLFIQALAHLWARTVPQTLPTPLWQCVSCNL